MMVTFRDLRQMDWGPKELLAVLTMLSMLVGGVSWLQHINTQVKQISEDLQPVVQMQMEHDRRLIVVEQRTDEWKSVSNRLSSLEQQMARQTAILEQLLTRLEGN